MISSTPKALLKLGSSHQKVIKLQQLLSQKVGPISITGIFDYETEIAVKTFQSRMFLKPDGIVGFLTWQALYTNAPVNMPTLRQGCHGSAVESVQELLSIDLYYTGMINGQFDPEMYQAVKRFQADQGLPTTGVVDALTWQLLSEI
ncbi:putative peptidoglycan-binding domain-containing protein [Leptolyngbya sp. PCC 7375]|nr:putative peptidoglycan-binding domain-containing protein [Leptolyngbya sp. PCC 7375]